MKKLIGTIIIVIVFASTQSCATIMESINHKKETLANYQECLKDFGYTETTKTNNGRSFYIANTPKDIFPDMDTSIFENFVKLETIVKESDFVATVNRYLGIKGEVRLQIIDDSNRKFSSLGALIRFDDHIEYER